MWYGVFLICGGLAAVVAALITHERRPRDIMLTLGMGLAGAVLGGIAGRAVPVSTSPTIAGAVFAALVGAVVLLAVQHRLVGGPRDELPTY